MGRADLPHAFRAVRSQEVAVEDSGFKDLNRLRIGPTRDDAAEQELLRQGGRLDRLVRVPGMKEQLELLEADKVDVIARDEVTLQFFMDKHGTKKETIRKVRSISAASLWYAFSKDVPDSVVKDFQDSLKELKKDGAVARVIKSYGIEF